MEQKRVLVLGASGRFGRHCANEFRARGWIVDAFRRGQDDLMTMAQRADVIIFGWNPKYPDWVVQYPDLTDQVIRAARVNNATIIYPANVYRFGKNLIPSGGRRLCQTLQIPYVQCVFRSKSR